MNEMLDKLKIDEIKNKPSFLREDAINYLVLVGSHSYGAPTESSDYNFYGFIVPPMQCVFPHTIGHIDGFEQSPYKFEQWEKMQFEMELGVADVTIFNIVKYFRLITDCNPNIIHSLFVPDECVVAQDSIGAIVRNNREVFLSKKAYYTFKGMALSHLKKIEHRKRVPEGKRARIIEKHGYDTKDASYCIRLLLELEEIMKNGTLTLTKNTEVINKIRQGYYTLPEVLLMANEKTNELQKLWNSENSYLHLYGDTNKKHIKWILTECFRLSGYPLNAIGFNFCC